jgi:hypothetical protein
MYKIVNYAEKNSQVMKRLIKPSILGALEIIADMGQKRHPSIHNHSKVFNLINAFESRPINRIYELNGPHIAAERYRSQTV